MPIYALPGYPIHIHYLEDIDSKDKDTFITGQNYDIDMHKILLSYPNISFQFLLKKVIVENLSPVLEMSNVLHYSGTKQASQNSQN